MHKYLPKSDWPDLLQSWMERGPVYAPQPQARPVHFAPLADPSGTLPEDGANPRHCAKSLFLPQSQVMMQFEQGRMVPPVEEAQAVTAVGLRPCDARAMTLLDEVFLAKPHVDPYWKARRDNTLVMALACTAPCETCFCMGVGSGPFDSRGSDALLVDTGEGYVVQLVTEAAADRFASLADAPLEMVDAINVMRREAEAKIAVPFSTERVKEKLYVGFDSDVWDHIAQSCLGCGVCTFLCPTCHCFDIVDETLRGQRVRNWDTCMFRIYSQEASGHNPRTSNLERTRNRIMHKYAYFPDKHGDFACTGCGRCVQHCPVNIDIRQIILQVLDRE